MGEDASADYSPAQGRAEAGTADGRRRRAEGRARRQDAGVTRPFRLLLAVVVMCWPNAPQCVLWRGRAFGSDRGYMKEMDEDSVCERGADGGAGGYIRDGELEEAV